MPAAVPVLLAALPVAASPRPSFLLLAGLALAALFSALSCTVAPAASASSGAQIYRLKCADCHGAAGEGVAGKYREALTGDWALSKLSHYVAKNMPEDAPETLSARDAAAVSAYIYEAFYSPAAQERLNPARIQLAHLTNRQFAVTVADLIGRFTPAPAPAPAAESSGAPAAGLGFTAYSNALRGRFDAAKAVHRGTDPAVDFVFVPAGPARERFGPAAAEFSAQWRGSVFAEETGDYEFVIRTPNSVRVWINAEPGGTAADATLDVNVSNPKNPDHRVTVRLLGGRAYPLAIDYWALPEKAGDAPVPALALRWKPPHGSETTVPARLLSTARVAPTFVLATKFPADDSSQGYERSLSVSKAWDEAVTGAAFEVANHVVRRLAGTRPGDPARAAKLGAFAEKFVAAAFRRPLLAEEKSRFIDLPLTGAPDAETGLRRVVLLALKSPQFLYVDLPSPADAAHRTAQRLAFALWDSAPDAALARAAAEGRLRAPDEVRAQTDRMLADARTRAKVREFFENWLQLRYLEDLRKDAQLFPDFSPEVIADLRTSLGLFVDDTVWGERSDFRDLLRSEFLFANARLARFYGLPIPEGEGFTRVAAPAGQRSGVLTHPYLLAALSYKAASSPIHRGVFLTRSIVGRALKPPTVAQTFDETTFAPGMTMREKVVRLTQAETCMGCHSVINPLGFSLEWYDAVGRFRTADQDRPIDAASDYRDDDNRAVRLASARDVADFALGDTRAQEAFIEQLFQYLVKQPPRAYGPDTLRRLRESFVASGFHLRKLVAEIAVLAAVHGESPPPEAVPLRLTGLPLRE